MSRKIYCVAYSAVKVIAKSEKEAVKIIKEKIKKRKDVTWCEPILVSSDKNIFIYDARASLKASDFEGAKVKILKCVGKNKKIVWGEVSYLGAMHR